jgi:hypothetical protein
LLEFPLLFSRAVRTKNIVVFFTLAGIFKSMKLNTKLLIPSFISALMVVAVFLQITYGACNPPEKMDCCIEQITTNITKQAEINLIPQEPQCVCMPIDAPSLEICAGVEVNINQAAEIEYLHKLIPNPNIAGAICLNTQQLRRVKTVVPELNTQWNVRNETFSTNGIGTVACVTVTNSGIYSFTFSVTAEDPAIIDSVSTVQTTITVRPMDEMPFYEPFTNDLFYMQGLHGVNGWAVNPPDKAADAKVFADSITNGILCVSPGGAPMSIQHLSCVDFEEGTNVPSIIYQEFMANFPLIDAPEPPFFVPDNTPAYFYLNAEGEVVFFQGGIDGGEWVTVSDGRKIPADTWVHYLLELDFTNQRWGLWLDGEPEIRYVPFSRPTKFYIGINWPLYPLENYWWEWGWSKDAWYHWWRGWRWQWRWWRWWWYMPFYYDYDMDNMPNWWEIKHGLNPYDPADA